MLAVKILCIVIICIRVEKVGAPNSTLEKKPLKPRIFVDFTRITDSGTPYSEPLATADFGVIVDFHRDSHLFLIDQADRVAFEKVLRVSRGGNWFFSGIGALSCTSTCSKSRRTLHS